MKKFLAIVMALAIVLGLCACGGNEQGGGARDENGKVTLKVSMGTNANVMDYENNALTKWLEEQTGYNLEINPYPSGSEVATQISTTIAAREDLPHILWGVNLTKDTIETYGKEGYFVDLKDYYADKEGLSKTFWTRIEENLTKGQQNYVVNKMTNIETGGIYGVPSIETSLVDNIDYMVWINTEWLDKLQLEKPTNTDELYKVLVAFRDKDPNGNGKKDEIPLFGSQAGFNPAHVVNMLVNLYVYYNDDHTWQDYNGDGKLESVYTQDKFREGLQFINKLYKEQLLYTSLYTAKNQEMKTIITPSSGTAVVGVFCGHLSVHCTKGNELMYKYENLKTWGYATENDITYTMNCFITETAVKDDVVEEAFNVLMTMWSEEGSMRVRYGEYGVNWTDADEGAVSDYGLKATFKLLDDPHMTQTTAQWGGVNGSLNIYAEAETAQLAGASDPWSVAKSKMHAEARKNFDEVAAANNPTNLYLGGFNLTLQDDEAISMQKTNFNSYTKTAIKDFVLGTNDADINDDADWKAFQDKMVELGYKDIQAMYQKYYELNK